MGASGREPGAKTGGKRVGACVQRTKGRGTDSKFDESEGGRMGGDGRRMRGSGGVEVCRSEIAVVRHGLPLVNPFECA